MSLNKEAYGETVSTFNYFSRLKLTKQFYAKETVALTIRV
jgi:hypothetical protein